MQEEVEVSDPREQRQRAERYEEIHERNEAHRRTENEIEAAPDDRDGQDQDGKEDEERLLLAQIFIVLGIRPYPAEPARRLADPTETGSGAPR